MHPSVQQNFRCHLRHNRLCSVMKDLTKTMHPRQPVENYSRHCSFPKLSWALKQKKLQKSCNLFSPVSRRSGPGLRKCPSTDSSAAAQIWNWTMIICTFCKASQIKTVSWSSQLLSKERVGCSKATPVEIPWTHLSLFPPQDTISNAPNIRLVFALPFLQPSLPN